jgi:hypothetical protein
MTYAIQTDDLSPARLVLAAMLSLGLIARTGECSAAEPETRPEVAPAATPSPSVTQPTPPSDRHPAEFRQDTLFGGGPIHHGGYGGPLVRFSQIAHETALFVGGRGGWLIDHRLLIGGAGMGQTLSIDAPSEAIARNPDGRNLELAYGGLMFGYHLAPEARLHGFVSVLIGGGGMTLTNRDGDVTDEEEEAADALFVLEPELALEANVVSFMRIQLSVAYRQVWDTEMPGLENQDLSGIAGGLALVFGQF